jgi:hypothetical protein
MRLSMQSLPTATSRRVGAAARPRARPSRRRASPTPSKETNPQLAAAEAEKQALSDAMLLVFTEKRTTTCFLCLGEQSLPFEKRTYKFASLEDFDEALQAEASGPRQRWRSARVQGLSNGAATQAASPESRREYPPDGFMTPQCFTKSIWIPSRLYFCLLFLVLCCLIYYVDIFLPLSSRLYRLKGDLITRRFRVLVQGYYRLGVAFLVIPPECLLFPIMSLT